MLISNTYVQGVITVVFKYFMKHSIDAKISVRMLRHNYVLKGGVTIKDAMAFKPSIFWQKR